MVVDDGYEKPASGSTFPVDTGTWYGGLAGRLTYGKTAPHPLNGFNDTFVTLVTGVNPTDTAPLPLGLLLWYGTDGVWYGIDGVFMFCRLGL